MGKNYTIYFKDECVELIDMLPGKGPLINKLVVDYFNNDIEHLQHKIAQQETKLNSLRAMLKNQLDEVNARKEQEELDGAEAKSKQEQHKKAEYERLAPLRELMKLYKAKKLTYKEYWGFRTLDGWQMDKIEEYLKTLS